MLRATSWFRILVRSGLLALLGLLAARVHAAGRIVLSEVMADPAVLGDAEGEFLELANAGAEAAEAESLRVEVDGSGFILARVRLAAGGHFLACRDSSALGLQGVVCGAQVPGMSLANGRALRIALRRGSDSVTYTIPAARAGVSWENTFAEEAGFAEFARAAKAFLGKDSATPGFRNSRSRRPAGRNLGIAGAAVGPDGSLRVEVADRGGEKGAGSLRVGVDADWDGTAETRVDSLPVPAGGGSLRVGLGPDHVGMLRLSLGGDEDPTDDEAAVLRPGGGSLEITEVCPAPEAGPEWAEVRNATGEGGGYARALSLARVRWEGRELGPSAGLLGPGEYLVLTEDSAAFRAAAGPLKVRVLEVGGWPALRNTGDTCRLAVEDFSLDSLAYGSAEAAAAPCLVRARTVPGGHPRAAPPAGGPTPGYPSPAPAAALSLRISRALLAPGASLEAEVEAPPGAAWSLQVFDLEGNRLATLGRGGAGRSTLAWAGEGPRGLRLPPGPYILRLAAGGHRDRRRAVVLAGP